MHSSIISLCAVDGRLVLHHKAKLRERRQLKEWLTHRMAYEQLSRVKGPIIACACVRDNRRSQRRLAHIEPRSPHSVVVGMHLLSECDRMEYFLSSSFPLAWSFIKAGMSVRVLLSYSLKSFIKQFVHSCFSCVCVCMRMCLCVCFFSFNTFRTTIATLQVLEFVFLFSLFHFFRNTEDEPRVISCMYFACFSLL